MRALLLSAACLLVSAARAQQPDLSAEAPIDEILVTGEFPGPGLWKVTRPDDASGHVMWIVGDHGPLPKGMKWKSSEIEATVKASQEILYDAGFNLTTDEKIGLLRGLTLVPAVLKARQNPDDAKLKDVLPPELYSRWLVQKKIHLGRDSAVESWRPMFAAEKLKEAMVRTFGLSWEGTVSSAVGALAGKQKIKQTSPQITHTFKRSEVRKRIKEFSRQSLSDVECMRATLELAEALGRRDVEAARDRAWARGDLAALQALPVQPNPDIPCTMAILDSEQAKDLVPSDLRERLEAKWLEAVEASLAKNQSTFAVLSFGKLTRQDGYLDLLRSKGYVVEQPG